MNERKSMKIVRTQRQMIYKESWVNSALTLIFLLQISAIVCACTCGRRRRAHWLIKKKFMENSRRSPQTSHAAGSLITDGDLIPHAPEGVMTTDRDMKTLETLRTDH